MLPRLILHILGEKTQLTLNTKNYCFFVQADDNADIAGTVEDEDESSDDPDLQVRDLNSG